MNADEEFVVEVDEQHSAPVPDETGWRRVVFMVEDEAESDER